MTKIGHIRAIAAFYGLGFRFTRGSGAPLPAKLVRKDRSVLGLMVPLVGVPLVGAALLTGCANSDPPKLAPQGLYCVDDSPNCVGQRSAALNELMGDKSRAWVREPAPVAAYASGVRLFAFKQRKREMTCEELAIGRREADAGPAILRGPDGKILSTSQIARGVMLCQEVGRELANEMKRRCKV